MSSGTNVKGGKTRSSSPRKPRRSNSHNHFKSDSKHTHSGGHTNKGNHENQQRSSHSSSSGGSSGQLNDLFKSMIRGAATSAAAQFTSGLGSDDDKDKTPSGTSGAFDLYLFAQTWAPRFCCTNESKCKQQGKDGVDDLTVHGLWPAYSGPQGADNRTYPAYCISNPKFSTSDKLAHHEYLKHGTCSNLSFDQYVNEESRLEDTDNINSLRDFLNSNAGEVVSISDIFDQAGGNNRVAIQASQYCQLQELTTCWAKAADGSVGEQIDCPTHVLGSGRNSAMLNKCSKLSLDTSDDGLKCAFISKELLKILKEA